MYQNYTDPQPCCLNIILPVLSLISVLRLLNFSWSVCCIPIPLLHLFLSLSLLSAHSCYCICSCVWSLSLISVLAQILVFALVCATLSFLLLHYCCFCTIFNYCVCLLILSFPVLAHSSANVSAKDLFLCFCFLHLIPVLLLFIFHYFLAHPFLFRGVAGEDGYGSSTGTLCRLVSRIWIWIICPDLDLQSNGSGFVTIKGSRFLIFFITFFQSRLPRFRWRK